MGSLAERHRDVLTAKRGAPGRSVRGAAIGALFGAVMCASAPLVARAEPPPTSKTSSEGAARPRAIVGPCAADPGATTEAKAACEAARTAIAEALLDLGWAEDTSRAIDPSAPEAELFDAARAIRGAVIGVSARDIDKKTPGSTPKFDVRVWAIHDGDRAVRSRSDRAEEDSVPARAIVLLRDVLAIPSKSAGSAQQVVGAAIGSTSPSASGTATSVDAISASVGAPTRSAGRPWLALHATIAGGFLGFSIERASGTNDPTLRFPLLAAGAVVGFGAALLAADEWNIGHGDAWYLASGAAWPGAAAHLLFEGRFGASSGRLALVNDGAPGPQGGPSPHAPVNESERWTFGLVGGTAGLSLAALGLALGDMSEGGSALAWSGGAWGLGGGALVEIFVTGRIDRAPYAGMGYGAAIGWLAAAAAATHLRTAPSRVLAIDLGALLGTLGAGAAASPLFMGNPTEDSYRGWAAATFGGALAGAGIAIYWTRGADRGVLFSPPRVAGLDLSASVPEVGPIAPAISEGAPAPWGVRWSGTW